MRFRLREAGTIGRAKIISRCLEGEGMRFRLREMRVVSRAEIISGSRRCTRTDVAKQHSMSHSNTLKRVNVCHRRELGH